MVAIFHIVRRDVLRFVRTPLRTLLLFAVPIALAVIFAATFGGGGGSDISIRVLLHDEDGGLLPTLLKGAAGNAQAEQIDLVEVGEEGYEQMERGEASALLHLPEGFTAAVLAGEPVALELVKNPAQSFLPQVVEEGVGIGTVVLSQASRVLRPELDQLDGMLSSEGVPSDLAVGGLSVAVNQRLQQLDRYLFPPVIALESITLGTEGGEEAEGDSPNLLSLLMPGLSILGILFFAQNTTRDILRERESGLVRHLMTTPVSLGQYLAGKCLGVLLITALGFTILVAAGVAMGAHWGSPPAVAALVLASSLAMGGFLLLLMSVVRNERQGDAITTVVIIVWSMIGGSFIPPSQIPAFLQPFSRSTFTFWAVDGFQRLVRDGVGLGGITLNLLVLTLGGILCLGLGAFFLRRRMGEGGL